jgi:hypothetical protein
MSTICRRGANMRTMRAMELHSGHIHQADAVTGVAATIWPTPAPGMWHISTSRKQATDQAVPTDQVEAVLAAWGFRHDGEWTHWKGPLHDKNPSPEIWALYDAIG